MQEIRQFIEQISPISEVCWQELSRLFEEKEVKARTVLCQLDEIPTDIYFLKKGIIRAYVLSADGTEYSKTLFSSPAFVGAIAALLKQAPSSIIIETLTECELYKSKFLSVSKLYEKYPDFERFGRKLFEQFFIAKEQREIELATLPATERYLRLRARIPELEQQLPQYQIASHLGITPTQLSRIRKALSKG